MDTRVADRSRQGLSWPFLSAILNHLLSIEPAKRLSRALSQPGLLPASARCHHARSSHSSSPHYRHLDNPTFYREALDASPTTRARARLGSSPRPGHARRERAALARRARLDCARSCSSSSARSPPGHLSTSTPHQLNLHLYGFAYAGRACSLALPTQLVRVARCAKAHTTWFVARVGKAGLRWAALEVFGSSRFTTTLIEGNCWTSGSLLVGGRGWRERLAARYEGWRKAVARAVVLMVACMSMLETRWVSK